MFTDDGVFLEEGVVAFTVADLEDELTDVEQVVSTDTQLGRKMQKKCKKKLPTFVFKFPRALHALVIVT